MVDVIGWLAILLVIVLTAAILKLLDRVEALEKRAEEFESCIAITDVSIQSLIACKQDKEM